MSWVAFGTGILVGLLLGYVPIAALTVRVLKRWNADQRYWYHLVAERDEALDELENLGMPSGVGVAGRRRFREALMGKLRKLRY